MVRENSIEEVLRKVISDLENFLPYLVLVGGWVPYIYAKYIWKYTAIFPLTTSDIDLGIIPSEKYKGKETISSKIRKLGYGERHISMDRLVPFVPIAKTDDGNVEVEIEFLTVDGISNGVKENLIGRGIKVNELNFFNILLEETVRVTIDNYEVKVPKDYAFIINKLFIFKERENKEKLRKDLYYIYYMLRFCPNPEELTSKVKSLVNSVKENKRIKNNIYEYFEDKDSKGPVFIEVENGPDEFIEDVRKDAYRRIINLL